MREPGILDGCRGYRKIQLQKSKKNEKFAKPVNEAYLKELEEKKATDEKQAVDMVICNALAAEMDEMWSFYHDKSHQIWLWRAVDHADNNFAYSSKIQDNQLVTGKKNTQRIERDHLTLRTRIKRLARKTICFSKDKEIHMAVVGTFINLFFFHWSFDDSVFL